ncbi:hypothetical protein [Kitasatospora sp. NPDC093679]|uniref:hypothetical protein n=1 Tax=Kitasatospora sp. NPDC093679 TaxID=3154983 RepID=UPI0034216DA2
MKNSLWDRISAEGQVEVDRLIDAGRDVQAIMLMREFAGTPRPGVHECVDLQGQRFAALQLNAGNPR